MHVLRVIGSMNPETGGPCQGIRNSIPALASLGCINEIVSLDDPSAAWLGNDTFPIHALGPGYGPWRYSPRLSTWLEQNLSRFDVVITHGLWLSHTYAIASAIRRLGGKKPKVCIMPHGMLDPWFQKSSSRRIKALRNSILWHILEKHAINEADAVLFTSHEELALARTTFTQYRPKKETIVGYGLPLPPVQTPSMLRAFKEACPGLGDRPYLLYMGRIHQKKGIDLLIEAYGRSISSSNLRPALVIAGPGKETPYGQEIQTLATTVISDSQKISHDKDAFPSPAIHFPGMLSGDTKWGALYGSEAFILPSHQENFGIAIVEALSCGKPVLISNQVNIWREILDARSGLVEADTLDGTLRLLTAWQTLTTDERQLMSKRAKACFEKQFLVKTFAKNFMACLHDLVQTP